MTIHSDGNFGVYQIRDQDDVAFFHRTAEKQCPGCPRIVKILPQYAHCASHLEQGMDLD